MGIDIAPENAWRTRTHLAFYGFSPEVIVAEAADLPLPDESVDIAFSNGVLHHVPSIQRALEEVFRVLRPGGEFTVIVYHRDSVFYWASLVFTDYLMRGQFRRKSLRDRLSRIEYTSSDARPIVRVYSRRRITSLLAASGFQVERTWVRKLAREDLPGIPGLYQFVWPHLPARLLDWLGRRWGWYVIARARKPADGA